MIVIYNIELRNIAQREVFDINRNFLRMEIKLKQTVNVNINEELKITCEMMEKT